MEANAWKRSTSGRIGLDIGPCIFGCIGQARHRSEFFSKRSDIIASHIYPALFRRTAIPLPSPAFHTHSHKMLQRTILRASRQQAARQIRAFTPLRQQSPIITRAAATPAIRWYSDAAPAKEGEAAEKKEDAPAEKNEVAQLKEQLEKKDKEIVDLKVRSTTWV